MKCTGNFLSGGASRKRRRLLGARGRGLVSETRAGLTNAALGRSRARGLRSLSGCRARPRSSVHPGPATIGRRQQHEPLVHRTAKLGTACHGSPARVSPMQCSFYPATIRSVDLSGRAPNVSLGRVTFGSRQAFQIVEDLLDRGSPPFLTIELRG